MLKFHAQAPLPHRADTQRRSPNFLSTVSYSDLSTKRPNPEYAQERAQRRTQTNKDGSSRRNWSISLSKFVVFFIRCAVRFQRPSRLRGVVDPFEEVV